MGPCNLNRGTGRRWVVTLMVHLLYPQGKWPWYPLCRNLDGPHRQSGWCGNRKIEPKFCGQPACSMLSQLLINPGATAALCLYMIYICLMQKVCFCSLLIFRELIYSLNKRTLHLYIINNFYKFFFICTMHLLLFCTMTNKCTIISQIITLLHVSTLSCHPQGVCNEYLAKLHKYFMCSCW
jgi:hypothetical protein